MSTFLYPERTGIKFFCNASHKRKKPTLVKDDLNIIVPRLVFAKFKSAFLLTFFGAENETRTRDPNLGKVVLYQLSYFRISLKWDCKGTKIF